MVRGIPTRPSKITLPGRRSTKVAPAKNYNGITVENVMVNVGE